MRAPWNELIMAVVIMNRKKISFSLCLSLCIKRSKTLVAQREIFRRLHSLRPRQLNRRPRVLGLVALLCLPPGCAIDGKPAWTSHLRSGLHNSSRAGPQPPYISISPRWQCLIKASAVPVPESRGTGVWYKDGHAVAYRFLSAIWSHQHLIRIQPRHHVRKAAAWQSADDQHQGDIRGFVRRAREQNRNLFFFFFLIMRLNCAPLTYQKRFHSIKWTLYNIYGWIITGCVNDGSLFFLFNFFFESLPLLKFRMTGSCLIRWTNCQKLPKLAILLCCKCLFNGVWFSH